MSQVNSLYRGTVGAWYVALSQGIIFCYNMVFSYGTTTGDRRKDFLTAFSKNLQSHAHPTTTSEEQLPPTASL